jgi:4-amino-4-deoxy-L-arabinose transferase-like glycosyltransferase
MRLPWAWTLVATVFLVLVFVFAAETPYRRAGVLLTQRDPATGQPQRAPDIGAPDERQHANYVRHLMDGKGFPVFRPGSPDLYETYQAHQPPAYYVLAAAWCKALGVDPTAGNGSGLRWLNALVGLATLFAVYFGALWGFGREDWALASTAWCLLPMVVALHGAASNDPFLFCVATWALALSARAMSKGWSLALSAGVGAMVGLGLLTKTTAVALFVPVVLALWFSRREPGLAVRAALALGLPLVVAAPWWIRNASLYGDPLALRAFNEAFVGSPQAAAFIAAFGAVGYWFGMVLWWTARSLVGVFGYMDVFLFERLGGERSASVYSALLVLLCFVAIAAAARSRDGDPRPAANGFGWVAAGFGLAVAVLFVRFNAQYFQGQARYLYPALGPIAWLLGAGACRLAGQRSKWAWAVVAALLLGLNLVALATLRDGFVLRTSL